jgi:hypothetical protein
MNDDNDDEQFMMNEWIEFSIVLIISTISLAAFCFWLGYLI